MNASANALTADVAAPSETTGRPRRGRAPRRDLGPLRALYPYLGAHRRLAVAAGLCLVASSGLTLGLTGAARLALDHAFSFQTYLIAAAVAVALALSTAGRFYTVNRLGERVAADLRRALYAHVLTLHAGYFATVRTGEVISRMTADMAIVEGLVGSTASVALRNLITLFGALVLLLVVSPGLTLVVVALTPVVLAPLFLVGRRVRRLSAFAQDRFAEAVAEAGESLDQLETVQAFGQEAGAASRFGAAVETAFDASLRRLAARAVMTALVMTLVFLGVASVLWLGADAVAHHRMTGGTLLQFLFLSVLAAGAVGSLGEGWGEVQKTAGAMERIGAIMAARAAIIAPPRCRPLPVPARGEVALQDVTFAYPGRDESALADFTLSVRPEETVALVGASGAGKSTVFRLLLRVYDPDAGQVLIDGVDVREADPAAVRARFALVAQDAALFSGSALDNVRFGRPGATQGELDAALQAAAATGFLAALPHGPSSPVGERGRGLSGGQRQRVAIARALVRAAPVLLLDEATSALDAENEGAVQAALQGAGRGQTTLVIAHRLSTVVRADRIVVMDAGRIVEEGDHAALLGRSGLYARLAELQLAA